MGAILLYLASRPFETPRERERERGKGPTENTVHHLLDDEWQHNIERQPWPDKPSEVLMLPLQ